MPFSHLLKFYGCLQNHRKIDGNYLLVSGISVNCWVQFASYFLLCLCVHVHLSGSQMCSHAFDRHFVQLILHCQHNLGLNWKQMFRDIPCACIESTSTSCDGNFKWDVNLFSSFSLEGKVKIRRWDLKDNSLQWHNCLCMLPNIH